MSLDVNVSIESVERRCSRAVVRQRGDLVFVILFVCYGLAVFHFFSLFLFLSFQGGNLIRRVISILRDL